jgi:transcriptional regulator with GAF, ATPase, and Fis domain
MHDITVLVTGETGTGKGSNGSVHSFFGPRADKPSWVVYDSHPETLVESELFGYVKELSRSDRNKKGFVKPPKEEHCFLTR